MLTLHTAFANYPHVKAIKDGSVSSPRIRFDFDLLRGFSKQRG